MTTFARRSKSFRTQNWVRLALAAIVAVGLAVAWAPRAAVAATFSSPDYTQNCDGRWEAFAVGPNGALYHKWQTTANGAWSGWSSLGGYLIYAQIAVFRNVTCHVEVLGVGGDGAMWHIWQTNPGGGPWSGWASLGGGYFTGGPSRAAFTGNGGDIVWGWTNGGASYVCDWQENPGAGPWSGWHPASVCAKLAVVNA
jgi:hypothetical protein